MQNNKTQKVYSLVMLDALVNKKTNNGIIDLGEEVLMYEIEVMQSLNRTFTWDANLIISTKIVDKVTGKASWGYIYSKKIPDFKTETDEFAYGKTVGNSIFEKLLSLPLETVLAFILKPESVSREMYANPTYVMYRPFVDDFIYSGSEKRKCPILQFPHQMTKEMLDKIESLGKEQLKNLNIDLPMLSDLFATMQEIENDCCLSNCSSSIILLNFHKNIDPKKPNLYINTYDDDDDFSLTRKN